MKTQYLRLSTVRNRGHLSHRAPTKLDRDRVAENILDVIRISDDGVHFLNPSFLSSPLDWQPVGSDPDHLSALRTGPDEYEKTRVNELLVHARRL